MKQRFNLAATSLSLLASLAWADSNLSVAFVNPETYSDATYSSSFANAKDRADVEREIEQHLEGLAERALPAGDSLKIEVLDIDLAGRVEPFRSRVGGNVRVISDINWPRMTLRYTLTQGDQTNPSREDLISDMNYLSSFNRYSSGDRLRYEKSMLDHWFASRFGTKLSKVQ